MNASTALLMRPLPVVLLAWIGPAFTLGRMQVRI
jgi:hypothetical protein